MRPFTLERLAALLRGLPDGSHIRHDVDVSLQAALVMAEFEERRDISATYYLAVASPFYWPEQARRAAEDIRAWGHDVGVHVPLIPAADLESLVLEDAARLQLGERPAVSFHRPPEELLWRDLDFCESAYAAQWEGRYYADSEGSFRFGDPEDDPTDEPLQVNLHAEWWFEPDWRELRAPLSSAQASFMERVAA